MEDFRFQSFIIRQYAPAKPFAVDRVRNALNTDRFFAIVQPQAVAAVIIAALAPYQGIGSFSLPRRHARQGTVWAAFNGRQVFENISYGLSLVSLVFGRP